MSETALITVERAGKGTREKTGAKARADRQFRSDVRPAPVDLGTLTPRQLETLQLLADGYYYKEIGTALGISHATVRAHLHAVYRKLNVKSRARAVIAFHGQNRAMPADGACDARASSNCRRA